MNKYAYAAFPAPSMSATTKTWVIILIFDAVTATLLLVRLVGENFLDARRAPIAWYSPQVQEEKHLERKTMLETPN